MPLHGRKSFQPLRKARGEFGRNAVVIHRLFHPYSGHIQVYADYGMDCHSCWPAVPMWNASGI